MARTKLTARKATSALKASQAPTKRKRVDESEEDEPIPPVFLTPPSESTETKTTFSDDDVEITDLPLKSSSVPVESESSSPVKSPPKKKARSLPPPREQSTRGAKNRAQQAIDATYAGIEVIQSEKHSSVRTPASKRGKKKAKDESFYGSSESEHDEDVEVEEEKKPRKRAAKKGTAATRTPKSPRAKRAPAKKRSTVLFTPDAELLEKLESLTDDTFTNTSSTIAQGNPIVASREAIRAVLNKDHDLLKRVVNDVTNVSNPLISRSVNCTYNALDLAIRSNDLEAAKILLKGPENTTEARVTVSSSLGGHDTGSYSKYTYGGRRIRAVHSGRGSKEGVNALTHDNGNYNSSRPNSSIAISAMKYPLTNDTVNFMITDMGSDLTYTLAEQGIYEAVSSGNLDVAHYVATACKDYDAGLNTIHLEVLKFRSDDDQFTKYQARSVTKKGGVESQITPIHFAAINPNTKFLKELTDVAGIHAADKNKKKAIHFAAACTQPTTVQLLIDRGAALDEPDARKNIPLHYACKYGRLHNIPLLLPQDRPQIANLKNIEGQTPLHLAAYYGHHEVVEKLLELGVPINTANTTKQNALFSAASAGHFETVKLLVEKGISLGQKDKHGRSVLHLAVMNGHYEVANYLIQRGLSPNAADSSQNSVLHFAAAYGWLNICKLLITAGADTNAKNDWKYNPLSVAFLKGFTNISDYFLDLPSVDINDKDGEGRTLLHIILSSKNDNTLKMATLLVVEKNASTEVADSSGNTLFHLLANTPHKDDLALAELLFNSGAPINTATTDGVRPLDSAVTSGNITLFKFLLENNAEIVVPKEKKNLLHAIATQKVYCKNFFAILSAQLREKGKESLLQEMANAVDETGRTPLLLYFESAPSSLISGSKYLDNEVNSDEEDNNDSNLLSTTMMDADEEEDNIYTPTLLSALGGAAFTNSSKLKPDEEANIYTPTLLSALGGAASSNSSKLKPDVMFDEDKEEEDLDSQEENDDMEDEEDEGLEDDDFIVGQVARAPERSPANDMREYLLFLKDYVSQTQVDINTAVVEIKSEKPSKKNSDEETFEDEDDASDDNEDDDDDGVYYGGFGSHQRQNQTKSQMIGYTALHMAANLANASLLTFLISEFKADVNAKDAYSRTPLHFLVASASSNDQDAYGLVKFLLQNGALLDIADKHLRTPIFYLFTNLVKQNTGQPSYYYGGFGYNNNQASNEPIEILSDLVNRESFSATTADEDGKSVLHHCAFKGFTICSMLLIQKGCDINAKDNLGNSPLAYAMIGSHIDFAVTLINKGADFSVDIVTEGNAEETRTQMFKAAKITKKEKKKQVVPLFKYALQGNHFGLAFLLVSRGIETTDAVTAALETHVYHMAVNLISKSAKEDLLKKNSLGQGLLHIAAKFDGTYYKTYCRKITKLLATRGLKLDDQDEIGRTPLHYSAEQNKIITKYLLKHGANLSLKDKQNGQIALHLACLFDQTDIVNDILKVPSSKSLVNTKDTNGRTPLHYAIASSPFGTYENTTMIQSLLDIGADYNIADNNNQSALGRALLINNESIIDLLKQRGAKINPAAKKEAERNIAAYSEQFFGLKTQFAELDVKEDAQEARRKLEEKNKDKDNKPKVHRVLRQKNNVVLEDENGQPYDVFLNKCVVGRGRYGQNSFYRQQIVHNKAQDLYILFTNYGRVGEEGQHQQTPFPKDQAITEFKKNFKSKSGLEWSNKDDPAVPNKYSVIQMKHGVIKEELKPIDLSKCAPSKLDTRIQDFFKLIADISIMQKGIRQFGVDLTLSRLHKKHLLDALNVLNNLKGLHEKFAELTAPVERKATMDDIMKESSKFFELIPHTAFRDSAIGAIWDYQLEQKRKMIEDLLDLQIASRILLGSTTKLTTMNPLDYVFNALKVELTPLDTSADDFSVIKRYINRAGVDNIINVFRVFKEDENEKFKPHLQNKNRMLLWHGSAVTNLVSILSQGLKIAPPEAPTTGFMFGKGIYFADHLSKSLPYSRPDVSAGVSCMLLCDVALGDMYECFDGGEYMEQAKTGYQSTKGCGSTGPDHSESFATFDGMRIPVGKIVQYDKPAIKLDQPFYNYPLTYNEYIVYSESQVRIRYIVQLKAGNSF